MKYYEVIHDPHRRLALGLRLTGQQLWQLLEEGQADGLEVTGDRFTFRLYQQQLYRLEADGQMRLWRMPTP